jgi:chromosome segregation ATPase
MIDVMIEKIPKGLMSPESERYIGMLLERIDDKFQFLKEGFASLELSIKGLSQRVARIEDRLDSIETDLAIVKEDLVTIKDTIVFLKSEASAIRKELKVKASYKELVVLNKRVSTLERKVGLA